MPAVVWERVGELREIVYRTIEDLSPPDRSFVFTNVLKAGDAGDEATLERVAAMAAARRSIYLPVHLTLRASQPPRARSLVRTARAPQVDRPRSGRALHRLVGHRRPQSSPTLRRRHDHDEPEESARRILDEWSRRSASLGQVVRRPGGSGRRCRLMYQPCASPGAQRLPWQHRGTIVPTWHRGTRSSSLRRRARRTRRPCTAVVAAASASSVCYTVRKRHRRRRSTSADVLHLDLCSWVRGIHRTRPDRSASERRRRAVNTSYPCPMRPRS